MTPRGCFIHVHVIAEKLFNEEEVKTALEKMWADTRFRQNMLESKIDELDEKLTNGILNASCNSVAECFYLSYSNRFI